MNDKNTIKNTDITVTITLLSKVLEVSKSIVNTQTCEHKSAKKLKNLQKRLYNLKLKKHKFILSSRKIAKSFN
jgi:hypothetical protein